MDNCILQYFRLYEVYIGGSGKRIRSDHERQEHERGTSHMLQRLTCLAFIAVILRSASAADEWKLVTAENGLPGNEIQFLKQDESGAVWIGTLQGLGVFRDGKFSIAVKDKQIFDVAPAGGGRHWVGTGDGVLLLDGGKAQEQLKGFLVAPLVAYDAKTTWAISKDKKTEENKLVVNEGSGWADVERFKAEKVVDVNRTPGGTLWVTIDGNGAYAVDPAKGAAQASSKTRKSARGLGCGVAGSGSSMERSGRAISRKRSQRSSRSRKIPRATSGWRRTPTGSGNTTARTGPTI
jgi:hypothetical protein